MKTTIQKTLQGLLLVPVLALSASVLVPALQPAEVQAQEIDVSQGIRGGADNARGDDQPDELFGSESSIFTTIVNTLLFIIGAVAVIMLIYGGFRYVTSAGDSSAVTSAKNTILYAVIGIVVALLAYAVLNFVVGSIAGDSGGTPGAGTGNNSDAM